jgi:hypothetical protein
MSYVAKINSTALNMRMNQINPHRTFQQPTGATVQVNPATGQVRGNKTQAGSGQQATKRNN